MQLRPPRMVLAPLLAVLAGGAGAADWPQARADAARGGWIDEELPAALVPAWSLRLPLGEPAWPDQPRLGADDAAEPVIAGGALLMALPGADAVVCLDAASGAQRWRLALDAPPRVPPAVHAGTVVIGADDGRLHGVALADGARRWSVKLLGPRRLVLGNGRLIDTWPVRGGAAIADGVAYAGAGLFPFMGTCVAAVRVEDGGVLWTEAGASDDVTDQPHGGLAFAGISPQGCLAVAGDAVLTPNGRATPACLDRASGRVRWFRLGALRDMGGDAVAVAGDLVLGGGTAQALADGGPGSGRSRGRAPRFAQVPPVVAGGQIIVGTEEGVALLGADGSLKRAGPRGEPASLVGAGARLYVARGDEIRVLALPLVPDAQPLARLRAPAPVLRLAAAGGRLFASCADGTLACFAAAPADAAPATATPARAAAPTATPATLAAAADMQAGGPGLALVWGAEQAVALALRAREGQTVVGIAADAAAAASARAAAAGLASGRCAILVAAPGELRLPPFLARWIVLGAGAPATALAEAAAALRPHGGRLYADAAPPALPAGLTAVPGAVAIAERAGAPPDAGAWTHEHADAANTRCSSDGLRMPLGLLWFGGPSNAAILPRHGHGPQPQAVAGRVLVPGLDMLRALDAYSGRQLWEAALPGFGAAFANLEHQPGANATNSVFVSGEDEVFAAMGDACVVLDARDGRRRRSLALPALDVGDGVRAWGYLALAGRTVVGGAFAARPGMRMLGDEDHGEDEVPEGGVPRWLSSRWLFALDADGGAPRWTLRAQAGFLHNGVAVAGGTVFAIDRADPPKGKTAKREPGTIVAIDLASGAVRWRREGVDATWLGYHAETGVLVACGRGGRDILAAESRGMAAFRGADGTPLWRDDAAFGPPLLRGDIAVRLDQKGSGGDACDLLTGAPWSPADPASLRAAPWRWRRTYGCNTPLASRNLLLFRANTAAVCDLAAPGGTSSLGGFRSSCTNNLIPACGVVVAPDYTRTCQCSYPVQTSLALVHDPAVVAWSYGSTWDAAAPPRRYGVNLAAPGDLRGGDGTPWRAFPGSKLTGAPAAAVEPATARSFRLHPLQVAGDAALAPVGASGALGIRSLRLPLPPGRAVWRVELVFLEPEAAAGERVFAVRIGGKTVAERLDVAAAGGGVRRVHVVAAEVEADGALEIALEPDPACRRPEALLCGAAVRPR